MPTSCCERRKNSFGSRHAAVAMNFSAARSVANNNHLFAMQAAGPMAEDNPFRKLLPNRASVGGDE
jgi:hypothetical protein